MISQEEIKFIEHYMGMICLCLIVKVEERKPEKDSDSDPPNSTKNLFIRIVLTEKGEKNSFLCLLIKGKMQKLVLNYSGDDDYGYASVF